MSRSVSSVSMARSEYCRGPPRVPMPTASQVAIASGANHTVISPRWTSARSYAGQFPTWYLVMYFGCTLDFMSRSCTCCRYNGQDVERGSPRARDPCTNAVFRGRPLPCPDEGQTRAVEHEMETLAGRDRRSQTAPQMLTAPGKRCFRHELLLSRPYLLLTKALRQDFHNRRRRQRQNRL